MPEKPVIINNSPLVALWQLGHLALLRELYTKVLIPEEVESPRFIVGRGPVPRRAPGYPTIAGDRPPRYGCGGRLPFIVGRGPSDATRACERVSLAMPRAAEKRLLGP